MPENVFLFTFIFLISFPMHETTHGVHDVFFLHWTEEHPSTFFELHQQTSFGVSTSCTFLSLSLADG